MSLHNQEDKISNVINCLENNHCILCKSIKKIKKKTYMLNESFGCECFICCKCEKLKIEDIIWDILHKISTGNYIKKNVRFVTNPIKISFTIYIKK